MKKVRVGVIGSGFIMREAHLPGYAALDDAEVVAIADINREHAKKAADKFGISKVFTDYRKILEMDEIDAVDIATPNAWHAPYTIAALAAGKHVLVEKPMALTPREGEAMIAAARKSGKILMVGLNCRFLPETALFKQAIKSGALGEIYYAEATFLRRRGIPGWGAFTEKAASGGGPMLDLGVHVLDWAMYLMGFPEPVAVSGMTYAKIGTQRHNAKTAGYWSWDPKKFEVEDLAVGMVRFRNGATLILRTSWAVNLGKDQFQIALAGTKGGLQNNPTQIFREEYGALVDITPQDLPKRDSHKEEIKAFIQAIRKGLPSPVSAESALPTIKVLDGIYRSSEKGGEVALC